MAEIHNDGEIRPQSTPAFAPSKPVVSSAETMAEQIARILEEQGPAHLMVSEVDESMRGGYYFEVSGPDRAGYLVRVTKADE